MPRDRAPPLFPEFDAARSGLFEPSPPVEERSILDGAAAESTAGPLQDSVLPVSPLPSSGGDSAASDAVPDLSRDFNRERTQGMARRNKAPPTETSITKLITSLSHRHGAWQVFADFNEMAATALSNAVYLAQRDRREARYMEIIKRYTPDELAKFPEMLAALTGALENETTDVLGRTFHELELHNKYAGQFFTPYPICQMMATMTLGPEADIRSKIEGRGFITASEPACGSGAMVIALAHGMKDLGINYQQHLHVTAVDVDAKCVHMAYTQFALLHIPAIIVHGNTLKMEEWDHWFTPAHILGGWQRKLKRAAESEPGGHVIEKIPEPVLRPESRKDEAAEEGPPLSRLTLF
jgi:hypothetical protein